MGEKPDYKKPVDAASKVYYPQLIRSFGIYTGNIRPLCRYPVTTDGKKQTYAHKSNV